MPSLGQLSLTLRGPFTSFLILIGIGYLMALSYLFLVDVEPHRQMGMGLISGIAMKYHGTPGGTRLEMALSGIMSDRIEPAEPMKIASTVTYGNYFRMVGHGPFRISLTIHIPGEPQAISAEFEHRHQ
jgi:hypothetical protein